MKFKLKDRKRKNGKIVAEITTLHKEVVRTKCLDLDTIVNGRKPESDYRSPFSLVFLDKYHPDYDYGQIIVEYMIFPGTKYSAFITANFFQRVYLKLLFERYFFQRISSIKSILIGLIIGIVTTVVGGLILNFFTCN